MEHTPLVTVLVTTYNQEKYIAQALDSVLAQKTDFPFNLIVIDNHPTAPGTFSGSTPAAIRRSSG